MLIILFLAVNSFAIAQQGPFVSNVSNVGTVSAVFLNIGIGARASALGGAFTAIADDAAALYWNPAGITRCHRVEVTFNHSDWFLDIYHEFVGAVIPAGRHSFGASITYLGVPDQKIRTIEEPEGTGKFYNASDLAIGLSYGFQFTDQFAMGLTIKYIREQIYNTSASAGALDLGVFYQPSNIKWLQLGMQIANFGSDMRFTGHDLNIKVDQDPDHNSNNRLPASMDTDAFSLPLIFRFGLAAIPIQNKYNRLITAIDLIHPSNNSESLNVGVEYVFRGAIALRAGYHSLFERDYEISGGLTMGGGIKFYTAGMLLILDYAYRDFGILNMVSRVSCGLRF